MTQQVLKNFGNGVLDGLVELSMPEPIGWSFDAPGWRALIVVALVYGAYRSWRRWQQWKANAYRREGLCELNELRQCADWQQRARRLPVVLKSVALHAFPRDQVASLSGDDWIAFLTRANKGGFDPEAAMVLNAVAYQAPAEWTFGASAVERCERAVREWIASHGGVSDV